MIGSDVVAKAKPDGYTLLGAGVPIAFNTALGRKLPYDAVKDFTPISLVVTQPLLVVVHPSVPVNSMTDLMAYAKAQKQPLQYTTGGIGSYGHLWWEMVRARQGIDGQHVPYNGIAPALKDVMGGQVPLLIDAIVPSRACRCRRARSRVSPSSPRSGRNRCPTCPRSPNRASRASMRRRSTACSGPAGMDAAVVGKLHASLAKALATPAVREKLESLGFDVVASSPESYAKTIRDEIDRWSKVVREQNIKVE